MEVQEINNIMAERILESSYSIIINHDAKYGILFVEKEIRYSYKY